MGIEIPTALWQVSLLGGFSLDDGVGRGQRLQRLPSRAATALLARLALWPQRQHAREELIELLWPGVDPAVARNRLRQTLSTLRSLIEAPGAASVLLADRFGIRVVAGALGSDVAEFERALRDARFDDAARLYRGELLPGHYDEWINDERTRLAALADTIPQGTARAPQAPAKAPAAPDVPVSMDTPLPSYITRYFGDLTQARRLREQVLAHRLVTLSGPGGSGKTRMAVELAHGLRRAQRAPRAEGARDDDLDVKHEADTAFDQLSFVPLAGCADATAMLDAIAAALRLRSGPGELGERIASQLSGHRTLLVLDNMEHLLPHAADAVSRLVESSAELHVLVTSRRLLGVDGERELRIAALALPQADEALALAAVSPALALFVDRARGARADFHVTARNVGTLVELVRSLQGMPLAIELAASRVRSVGLDEMLARLRSTRPAPGHTPTLDMLQRGGARAGFDARHASMQRVVQWSWQQLSPLAARFLAGMTVFDSACSAAAAHAVCSEGGQDAHGLLDELMAHSMLMSLEADDGSLRFSQYQPVREYAAAQLDAADAARLRARHRQWWLRWAAGLGATPPLADVRAFMPDLAAAIASALADGVPDDALRLSLALRSALIDVSLPSHAMADLDAALRHCHDDELASAVHTLLGMMQFDAGQRDTALAHVQRGAELARAPTRVRARALQALASVRWRSRHALATLEPVLDEAMQLARTFDDIETQAGVLALRAFIANVAGRDFALGESLHRQALALWQQLGNAATINGGVYNLAVCAQHQGRWGEALMRLETVLDAARQQQDWQLLSSARTLHGNTLAALREWPAALVAYREAADLAWTINDPYALAYAMWNTPPVLAHLHRPQAAARLMAFISAFWQQRFGPLDASDRHDQRRVQQLVRALIDEEARVRAADEGRAMTLAAARQLMREA